MTEIKRYDVYGSEWWFESGDDGEYVRYDDHAAELAHMRAENERLRILVKDSVNLLDFLFEPGSYVPAVRLFCEKVKEELK